VIKGWREFSVAVRRRETPFYDRIYRLGKRVRNLSLPCIRPLHSLLYWEFLMRTTLWHNFWRVVYYEPMFKSQCVSVGKGFRMQYTGRGTIRIEGNLAVYIGSNVTLFDSVGLVGLKIFENPELHVGDNTYLAPKVRIMVGKKVKIGNNCMIGSWLITDNPGHSVEGVSSRLEDSGGSPLQEDIRPVEIGDFCMIAVGTYIYPGVKIGDGVVARLGSHITQSIPPFCLVAGNPARIIRKLPIPSELVDLVGEGRYEAYLKAHEGLKL
jgi:acetyltransferase-like isoleucine patch superfamily enzyme